MAKGNLKLTSVKVDADVFEEFKVECLRDKFTLCQERRSQKDSPSL